MKKVLALLLAFSMILPIASCGNGSNTKLNEKGTSWSAPDEKYKTVLELYGGSKCNGTMVVATDEDIVYLYCEDGVEKDGKTPVSQNTVFDIGSCSKVFTAVCILQLAEQGKLDINDALDKYFPEYET